MENIDHLLNIARMNTTAFINNRCRDLDRNLNFHLMNIQAKTEIEFKKIEYKINPGKQFTDLLKKGFKWLIKQLFT